MKGTNGRGFSRRAMVQSTALGLVVALSGKSARAAVMAGGYRPRYFDEAEWAAMSAFVDRLIPADAEGPGALEAHVPEFIDRQMMTPYGFGGLWYMHGPFAEDAPAVAGYQLPYVPRDIYRLGLRALDAAMRKRFDKPFADLSPEDRDSIITEMQQGKIALSPVPGKTLFNQMLKNCKEGYFADPVHGGNAGMAAWMMIGFPGARADYTDFVNLGGARYPLGPVSIVGSAGAVRDTGKVG